MAKRKSDVQVDGVVGIETLTLDPSNACVHDAANMAAITESISKLGAGRSVLLDADGIVRAGNGSVAGARAAGIKNVRIIETDGSELIAVKRTDLIGAKAVAMALADNRASDMHGYDAAQLRDSVQQIESLDLDLAALGLDADSISELCGDEESELIEDLIEEDEVPEPQTESITKPGDAWVLGSHRLVCGDSTKIDDFKTLMAGELADMIFTDTPYNVAYEGGTSDKLQIKNDDMSDVAFGKFLTAAFKAMFASSECGAAFYICHADSEGFNFRAALKSAGFLTKQCIIWVKNAFVMGRQDYQWRHEPILYGWKPGASHRWYGDRKTSTVIEPRDGITATKSQKTGWLLSVSVGGNLVTLQVPAFEIVGRAEEVRDSVWRFPRPSKNPDHPTMKPVSIPARAIANSSKAGEVVLDGFGGSGSTMSACEQLGRKAFLMELDPTYCDVIVERWQNLTGKKAKRESNR